MNAEKKMQEWSETEKPLTDLEVRILELYRQLSPVQKKIVLLSVMLSAAANNHEEVQA